MQLGMIGLGRMGAAMSRRLMAAGHRLVVTDPDPAAVAALELNRVYQRYPVTFCPVG